jgi:hypothetical protein
LWSLVGLAVYSGIALTVLLTVVIKPKAEHQRVTDVVTSYLDRHAVKVEPWVTVKGPSVERLGIDGRGTAYAFAGGNGGVLTRISPSGTQQVQRLVDPTHPPLFFGFAVGADGTSYASALSQPIRPVFRVAANGKVDKSWAGTSRAMFQLVVDSSGQLLSQETATSANRSLRIVKVRPGLSPQLLLTLRDVTASIVPMAAGPSQTVYLRNGSSIGRLSTTLGGKYEPHWVSVTGDLPRGTPKELATLMAPELKMDAEFGDVPGSMAVSPSGDVLVSTGATLWKFSSTGELLGRWWIATPDGQTTTLWALAASPDGTVYTTTPDGIAKLSFPSASS